LGYPKVQYPINLVVVVRLGLRPGWSLTGGSALRRPLVKGPFAGGAQEK
jgi:hypothetical protein